jgi:hypothetical protein
MRADFTIGGGCVKKMIGYRILLDEIFTIKEDVLSGYQSKPKFPLTIYPADAKMRAYAEIVIMKTVYT